MNNCIPFPGSAWAASATAEALQAENSLLIEEQEAAAALLATPAWAKIDQEYERATGYPLKPWQVIELAAMAIPPLVISLAIQDTRKAPRPSFYYLRAILRRFQVETLPDQRDALHYLRRNQAHRERNRQQFEP